MLIGKHGRDGSTSLATALGTRYCVLHYPGEKKNKADFLKVVKSELDRKDYDFSGTVFPRGTANFAGREFDSNTIFTGATFVGKANFLGAQFSGQRSFSASLVHFFFKLTKTGLW
jgi:uncharacterized protein YjbI with pentapeptide repeats